MNHTPGPWRTYAAKTSTGEETIGIMTDKEYMAMMETVSIDGGPYKLPPRAVANARLMAAAPELLEALQGCEAALVEAGKDFALWNPLAVRPNLYELHAQAARAAIARATGEEVTPC